MTLSEFKAWFEGFTEGIDKAPTEAQFAKIKDKVSKIDGAPITYPIYVEKYVYPRQWPYYGPTWIGDVTCTSGGIGSEAIGVINAYAYIDPASKGDSQTVVFDSHAAMRNLGRAEAMN